MAEFHPVILMPQIGKTPKRAFDLRNSVRLVLRTPRKAILPKAAGQSMPDEWTDSRCRSQNQIAKCLDVDADAFH